MQSGKTPNFLELSCKFEGLKKDCKKAGLWIQIYKFMVQGLNPTLNPKLSNLLFLTLFAKITPGVYPLPQKTFRHPTVLNLQRSGEI